MVQECHVMIYVDVRTRLKLNIKMKCFQDRRPQWFTNMEEWKRMFGQVNVEHSTIEVVFLEDKLGKHLMK